MQRLLNSLVNEGHDDLYHEVHVLLPQQHCELSAEPGHQSVGASWVLTEEGGSWRER